MMMTQNVGTCHKGQEFALQSRTTPSKAATVQLPVWTQEDHSGSTLDSMVKGPPCPQQDFYLGQHRVSTSNASEDCLHLNIWSPAQNCSPEHESGSDDDSMPHRCSAIDLNSLVVKMRLPVRCDSLVSTLTRARA